MSSHTKDPLEQQDTPSESSDSHSDSEVDKAEENLEQLKIEELLTKETTKEDSEVSKPVDSPSREGPLTGKNDLLNQPVAGPSGLQKPRSTKSDGSSDPDSKVAISTGPGKEKDAGTEDVDGNMDEPRMVEGDSDTTSSTPPFIQSSTGETASSVLNEMSPVAGPSKLPNYADTPLQDVIRRFMYPKPTKKSPSSRRYDYATDSARTSADVSEIRSEVADSSAEGSVYHDAPENIEKEQSPIFVSADERLESSETSDTNISDLQEDIVPPPTPESSSISTSTDSRNQGHNAYLEQLQREAEARGVPISTSSGIASTDQSELARLKEWGLAGERGSYRRNVDDPSHDVSYGAQGGDPQPVSDSMEDEPMQVFDRLFDRERNQDNVEEPNVAEGSIGACPAPRIKVEKNVEVGGGTEGSPYKRRRPSKCLSDSSREDKETIGPRIKPDKGKKSKIIASKFTPTSSSSSESTEPKSSSSDEPHRKESPEIKSSSPELSKSEKGRKPWQKPGRLRSMQFPTMSSESVIAEEEEDQTSPLRDQDSKLVETEDPSPEKMETTPEKGSEGAAEDVEPLKSKLSIESSDQAYVSEAQATYKEQEQSLEVSDFERTVGKSKRDPKVSCSPPSDETLGSSPSKAATNRPKKKAKSEKMPAKTPRTRRDSGGSVPKSVSLGDLHQSSTSTPDQSDYTPSDDEKETEL